MSTQSPGPDGPASEHDPGAGGPRWRMNPDRMGRLSHPAGGDRRPVLVGTYSRIEPRLFGFPFFYSYQLAWIFLAAACCATSFALLRREQRAYERIHPRPSSSATSGGAA